MVRSGSRWAESGVGSATRIASTPLQLVVVGGRAQQAGVDVLLQLLGRDVLDVALAAVQLRDAVGLDVHEHDGVARVGEDVCERDADVAGSDDGDRAHAGVSV